MMPSYGRGLSLHTHHQAIGASIDMQLSWMQTSTRNLGYLVLGSCELVRCLASARLTLAGYTGLPVTVLFWTPGVLCLWPHRVMDSMPREQMGQLYTMSQGLRTAYAFAAARSCLDCTFEGPAGLAGWPGTGQRIDFDLFTILLQ